RERPRGRQFAPRAPRRSGPGAVVDELDPGTQGAGVEAHFAGVRRVLLAGPEGRRAQHCLDVAHVARRPRAAAGSWLAHHDGAYPRRGPHGEAVRGRPGRPQLRVAPGLGSQRVAHLLPPLPGPPGALIVAPRSIGVTRILILARPDGRA